MRRILFSMGAACAIACGETRLDAGSSVGNPSDAGQEGELFRGTPSNSLNLPCDLPAPDFVAGTWVGSFDTLALPSGSSTIRIDVKGSFKTADGLCGTVVFGEGAPLPLPTDPSTYPPGAPTSAVDLNLMMGRMREGFPYEYYQIGNEYYQGADIGMQPQDAGKALPLGVQGNRIQFSINLLQIYNAWCNMQRSYASVVYSPGPNSIESGNTYSCVPPLPLTEGPGTLCEGVLAGITVHGVSCIQAEVCALHYCSCTGAANALDPSSPTAGGCSAGSARAAFDFHVTGEEMMGAINLPSGIELAHLTRVPAPGADASAPLGRDE